MTVETGNQQLHPANGDTQDFIAVIVIGSWNCIILREEPCKCNEPHTLLSCSQTLTPLTETVRDFNSCMTQLLVLVVYQL